MNDSNQTDQIDETDETDETDPTDKTDQTTAFLGARIFQSPRQQPVLNSIR